MELANELKHKVSKYVMNPKRVPKHWRYINGKPAIDYARHIRDCVSRANDISLKPGELTDETRKERSQLQDRALSYCNILQLQLQDIVEECDGATDENIQYVVNDLSKLISKIMSWKKSDKERISKS
jgi:hypothetical protein